MSGHIAAKSTYYAIFGTLLLLTGATIAVAFVNLGPLNFPVALGIAVLKATLVVLFFMHLKYSSKLTKMVVGLALFFLGIMFTLTLTDYLSRGWNTSPTLSGGAGMRVSITPPTAQKPADTTTGTGQGR
jgi:cytochrome c oxidase subunit 4